MRLPGKFTAAVIGALLCTTLAACGTDADKPNNTHDGSELSQNAAEMLEVQTSGVQNVMDPCLYVHIEHVWDVADESLRHITLVTDRYAYDGTAEVRQCLSHGDGGARLTITSVMDNPGDDTSYNSMAGIFPSRESLNADSLGIQAGEIILEDNKPTGIVYKTVNDAVVAMRYGAPATSKEALIESIKPGIATEEQFLEAEKERAGV